MLTSTNEVVNLYNQWKVDPEINIVKELYQEVFGLTFLIKDPDGNIIRVCLMD